MTPEMLQLGLDAKLTANEWKVLAAMCLGHLDIYDIQRATGLQKVRVEQAVQNAHTIYNSYPLAKKISLKDTVQNARRTPPLRILDFLYRSIGRREQTTYHLSELTPAQRAYDLAYKRFDMDQLKAETAVEDCITAYLQAGKGYFVSDGPGRTLEGKVAAYLSVLPAELPLHIWEAERSARGTVRFRFDHLRKTDNWIREYVNS